LLFLLAAIKWFRIGRQILIVGEAMAGIVCAIRGGPASEPTIERAISLAREQSLPLYFLYVVNLDFMTHTSLSRVHALETELHHLGEFILLSASSKAEELGIQVEGMVRQGSISDEIVALCNEKNVDYIVLGQPSETQEENAFTGDQFEQFIQRLQEDCQAEVLLANEKVE
jgi:nucleotide-binding universal stress UspA family protein